VGGQTPREASTYRRPELGAGLTVRIHPFGGNRTGGQLASARDAATRVPRALRPLVLVKGPTARLTIRTPPDELRPRKRADGGSKNRDEDLERFGERIGIDPIDREHDDREGGVLR
jgi:hypothetical protein